MKEKKEKYVRRRERKFFKISNEWLCEALKDLDIECGYIKPTKEQKIKLAKALEVKVDWLFQDNKNDKSKFKAWILKAGRD